MLRFNGIMDQPESPLSASALRALVAELAWSQGDGVVRLAARTPLVLSGEPALALTYDDRDLADRLADADEVMLVLSDARHTLPGWQPLAVPVVPAVAFDPEGERFTSELVEQELAKHPPARLRADSLLQRRENWWYLARVLVTLRPAGRPRPIAARSHPDSGVLCWNGGGLQVATVSVDDWGAERLRLGGVPVGAGARGSVQAALLRHDFTADLERRATLVITGRLDGDTLWPAERGGQSQLPPPPSAWRRIRQAWAYERACRRAITAAGH